MNDENKSTDKRLKLQERLQYVAQYPDTSVYHCNNFPFLIARALEFGPEKIYLVLNMMKDSLTFLPLFPLRN